MTRSEYKELLIMVNDKPFMEKLQRYADLRIEMHRGSLEREKDTIRIYERQGSIAELRRISTLRDEVIKGVEDASKS